MTRLLIGELAQEADVNPKTIRYYEEIELIPPPERTPSGYRQYGTEDVERLRFIRDAQQLDLHLDEIREILALREQNERPCEYVLDVAAKRAAELDDRIRRMTEARDELVDILERANETPDDTCVCSLLEHRATLA